MATKVLRPCIRSNLHKPHVHSRHFFANPFTNNTSEPTANVLTASRTLPYPALPIFDIIADISFYPCFLPYCTAAKVTSHSEPDAHYKRRWPQTACLTIGFQDKVSESFMSRIYCVPPTTIKGRAGVGVVEAVSGSDTHGPSIAAADDIKHHTDGHGTDGDHQMTKGGSPMTILRTCWQIRGYPYKPHHGKLPQEESLEPVPESQEMTDVSLRIEYAFKNPMYEVMSKALAPQVADTMMQAFEKRVQDVLGEGMSDKRTMTNGA